MLNEGQLTVTFVETGEGSEADAHPPIVGILCTVTVYEPGPEYTCVTLQGVMQAPIFV
jgi:hypothetical protein